jgi:hypothetical protein
MSTIKGIGIAIMGLLAGALAVLYSMFSITKKDKDDLEAKLETAEQVRKTDKKIDSVVAKAREQIEAVQEAQNVKKPPKGKDMLVGIFALFALLCVGCAPAQVATQYPELEILYEPEYQEVLLRWNEDMELYTLTYEEALTLQEGLTIRDIVIEGYKEQVCLYRQFVMEQTGEGEGCEEAKWLDTSY